MGIRLGPKEKSIIEKLIPGDFVPPSIYLGDYDACPSNNASVRRIVHKKRLAEFGRKASGRLLDGAEHNGWPE